ncbi:hypothetical protein CRG98_004533 [Punica granatum]|nr:hypothetical protein CRG98_004533 [Punica granatum]
MTFYWSKEVTLLVDSWRTRSWVDYALTLLACFLASAFYQLLEDRRVRLNLRLSSSSSSSSRATDSPDASLNTTLLSKSAKIGSGSSNRWSRGRVTEAVMFGVNSAIGYLLMLAVMSFNGGVFASVVFGLAIGYLAFRNGDEVASMVVADNACACA